MRQMLTGRESRVSTKLDDDPQRFAAKGWVSKQLNELARTDEYVEDIYTFDVVYQGEDADILPEMVLDKGPDLLIKEVSVDGVKLHPSEYSATKTKLTIFGLRKNCKVSFVTIKAPKDNHDLQGTYESGGSVATQYETLGFKSDTPCLTRPDVMPTWSTSITVDPNEYPVVEATGDRTETRTNPDGTVTHSFDNYVPSAAYVQANAAGDLEWIADTFETMSGKSVELKVYGSKGKAEECRVLLNVLKDYLAWEEEVFGLEYPLSEYKIVVIDDFNFGAMENLGMNVFNAARGYIDFDVATDGDILDRYSIVSHEAAHTHSGNVTTLKSWHQIPLKEGLTRLRDQMYEEGVIGKDISRVKQVRTLKMLQFPIDASDDAKPVLQEEYKGNPMNSMYTPTAYEKGAELLRMVKVFLGDEVFVDSLKHFFEKHRAEAVTVDDLLLAIQEHSDFNLEQFRSWYSQVGTPTCSVEKTYDAGTGRTTLKVKQSCPRPPHAPLMMPMEYAFITDDGDTILGQLVEGGASTDDLERGVLTLSSEEHVFVFEGVPEDAVPSLFRGLSAPVHVEYPYSSDELRHLAAFDSDAVNKTTACEVLASSAIERLVERISAGEEPKVDQDTLDAYRSIIESIEVSDPKSVAIASSQLLIPSVGVLLEKLPKPYKHRATNQARAVLMKAIGEECGDSLQKLLSVLRDPDEQIEAEKEAVRAGKLNVDAMNRRKLRSASLQLLCQEDVSAAKAEFDSSKHMTTEYVALSLLATSSEHSQDALEEFLDRWGDKYLARLKWIRMATTAQVDNPREYFEYLLAHEKFDIKNPNMCYEYARGLFRNYDFLYAEDGSGIEFYTDLVLRMKNENVAYALVRWFYSSASKIAEPVRSHMYAQLERLKSETSSQEIKEKCESLLESREDA